MVKVIADEFLTDDRERKYYADRYSCCPPPLFIIFITLVEVSFFLFWFFPPVKTLFFCRAVTHDRVFGKDLLNRPPIDCPIDLIFSLLEFPLIHPSVHPSSV